MIERQDLQFGELPFARDVIGGTAPTGMSAPVSGRSVRGAVSRERQR